MALYIADILLYEKRERGGGIICLLESFQINLSQTMASKKVVFRGVIILVHLKNPRLLVAVMFWRGFARKACVIEKIRGAKQNAGLKPPPIFLPFGGG